MRAFCLMILKCQKYAGKQHLSIIRSNSNESLAPSSENFKYPGKFPSLRNRWKQEMVEPSKLRGYIKLWIWRRNWNSPNHFNFHLHHLSSFSKSKLTLSVCDSPLPLRSVLFYAPFFLLFFLAPLIFQLTQSIFVSMMTEKKNKRQQKPSVSAL